MNLPTTISIFFISLMQLSAADNTDINKGFELGIYTFHQMRFLDIYKNDKILNQSHKDLGYAVELLHMHESFERSKNAISQLSERSQQFFIFNMKKSITASKALLPRIEKICEAWTVKEDIPKIRFTLESLAKYGCIVWPESKPEPFIIKFIETLEPMPNKK